MAIYDIIAATGYELPSASWINNNPDTRPKPSQFPEGPKCDNAQFSMDQSCVWNYGDRYLIQGKLRSSSLPTISNNPNFAASGLAIRIVEDCSAIRANDYDAFTNSFESGFPVSNIYYLPNQIVSSVYRMNNNYYSHRNPTTNIRINSYQWFLPGNYQDKFNSKDIILVAYDIDPALTARLNKNVYSTICFDNIADGSNCYGISASFVQPTGDISNDYTTYGNLGIAFDVINTLLNNSHIITNINHNGELIVRLVHDTIYNGSEISVKHPRINNYLLLNLPSTNSTLNLEDYQ